MSNATAELAGALESLRLARERVSEAERLAWKCLLIAHPEIPGVLADLGILIEDAAMWFCTPRFDERTLSAADLYLVGRGDEVVGLLTQLAHGVYR